MSVPPFFHWIVGVGLPETATVNVTLAPVVTDWLVGCVVNAGALVAADTVRTAPLLVAVPAELVATTVYVAASAAWTLF